MAEDVRRVLNCEPSEGQDEDWGVEEAVARGALARPRGRDLPAAVDLRADDWWPVADQGSTGSCVGWAAGDSVIRWHLTQTGRLARDQHVSVRYVWMASKETDRFRSRPTTFIENAGTSIKTALDMARKFGVVTEDVLPFGEARLYDGSPDDFYELAGERKIRAYVGLKRSPDRWREWLATQGPVVVRLDVDPTFRRARRTAGKLERYDADAKSGGHAVAFVGYDDTGFIVRNSWGTDWGDGGYGYATEQYARDAFTESYGISV